MSSVAAKCFCVISDLAATHSTVEYLYQKQRLNLALDLSIIAAGYIYVAISILCEKSHL